MKNTNKNKITYHSETENNICCDNMAPSNFCELTGDVVTKDSPNYNEARQLYNTYFNYYPLAIVYCYNEVDVINAVKWAKKYKINVKLRCGGHNYEGFSSSNGSLMIDVSNMKKFSIDKSKNLINIGSGYNLGDLYTAVAKEGYQFTGGTCPGVGICGIVGGGGVGLSDRTYGLVCDNLVNVKLINQEGKLIQANDKENPDLFYAIRGAGSGNFGVFVEFTFKVRPVKNITFVTITWPKSELYQVIDKFQKFATFSDERVNYELTLNKSVASLVAFSYADINTTMKLIGPLLKIPNQSSIDLKYIPFMDAVNTVGKSQLPPNNFKNTSSMAYELLPPKAIKTIIENLNNAPSSGTQNNIILFAFGGAIKSNVNNNTSFAHRNAILMLQYVARWQVSKGANENINWIRKFRSEMLEYTCDAYYNFPDLDIKYYKE